MSTYGSSALWAGEEPSAEFASVGPPPITFRVETAETTPFDFIIHLGTAVATQFEAAWNVVPAHSNKQVTRNGSKVTWPDMTITGMSLVMSDGSVIAIPELGSAKRVPDKLTVQNVNSA